MATGVFPYTRSARLAVRRMMPEVLKNAADQRNSKRYKTLSKKIHAPGMEGYLNISAKLTIKHKKWEWMEIFQKRSLM